MGFVIDNLRLKDLVAIVCQNQKFYEEFVVFLHNKQYTDVYAFINEQDDVKAKATLEEYLQKQSTEKLYDGIGRPYPDNKAKWYFLAWVLRDAPAQRLEPLLRNMKGESLDKRKATLLNQLRKFVGPLFPEAEKWDWPVLSEVMLARLEGSRRALKGTQFEEIVRRLLRNIFAQYQLHLTVGDGQITVHEETYDVQVVADHKTILIPVKTRETMGGGHANLFTRDIFKAISVAHENGYETIPIIIAESWAGDLSALKCPHVIYIPTNPNQSDKIEAALKKELINLLPMWQDYSRGAK
jgi:hypothetical protein